MAGDELQNRSGTDRRTAGSGSADKRDGQVQHIAVITEGETWSGAPNVMLGDTCEEGSLPPPQKKTPAPRRKRRRGIKIDGPTTQGAAEDSGLCQAAVKEAQIEEQGLQEM